MMDSPYVRRCFIVARRLGIPLEHKPLSVFQDYAEFHAINPLVRAPTLILDDGGMLVESTLIIDHFCTLRPSPALLPPQPAERLRCRQLTGLGLSLADKAVHLYYEIVVRPETLRWPEWITRTTGQLRDASAALEKECQGLRGWLCGDEPGVADITIAVAWCFVQHALPHILDPGQYPALAALGDRAEALPEFLAAGID